MPDLAYNLSVIGLRDVERGFAMLEQRVAKHVARVEQMTAIKGAAGGGGGGRPANTNAAIERQLEQQRRARERADTAETRAHNREADRRARYESQLASRVARDQEREFSRSEKKKTQEHEREAKLRARTEAQINAANERAAMRSFHESRERRMGIVRAVGGTLGAVGRSALAMTGLGGGALFANATHEYARTSATATELAGKIVGKGASLEAIQAQKAKLMGQSMGVQGFTQQQVLGVAGAFGGITGEYAAGMNIAPQLAKIALATGGDVGELSQVAGNAAMGFKGIHSGKALESAVLQAVRMFAGQGEAGAVEIKDLARYAGRLTSPAGQFAGSKESNFVALSTMAQVARGSGTAASAEEATTAVARFQSDVVQNRGRLKAIGVEAYNKEGKLRAPEELVTEIMTKTGGDLRKLNPIFGEMSAKTIAGFSNIYQAGEAKGKGGGKRAVQETFANFRNATLSESDVNTRATAMLGEQEMLIAENMKKLNEAVGKELAPVATNFIKYLGEMAPTMGKIAKAMADSAKWLAENPWKGIGLIVAGAITKEIAAAGIASAIKSLLVGGGGASLGGAVPGVAGAAGARGVGGAGGALGVIATGVTAGVATYGYLEATNNSNQIGAQVTGIEANASGRVMSAARSGMSDYDQAKAQLSILAGAESDIEKKMNDRNFSTRLASGGEHEYAAAKQSIAEQKAAAQALLSAAEALKMAAIADTYAPPSRGEGRTGDYNPNGGF